MSATNDSGNYTFSDLQLGKKFAIYRETALEIRSYAFQLSNTPQFALPNSTGPNGASGFGAIAGTLGSGQGSVNGIGGGRSIQGSAKISFQVRSCQSPLIQGDRPDRIDTVFHRMGRTLGKRSSMKYISRRDFLADAGITAAAYAARPLICIAEIPRSPFMIAVINDEISQDFDHACYVASHDFGTKWIELRSMWGKNISELSASQIDDTQKILNKYNLQVTDIASPLFKTDWPGAPKSQYSSREDMHGAAETAFKKQDATLEKSIALALQFKTGKIRCFDFWRLDDVAPYRAAIDDKLRMAAETAGKRGIQLVLENEFACNTATGRESARIMKAIQTPYLALNWDPANAVMRGELDAFPTAWETIPKDRIHHCHCKNAIKNADGKIEWSPVDKGLIDWAAQFRALKKAGYREVVSLETHWNGAATQQESTRISWEGMKHALKTASAF